VPKSKIPAGISPEIRQQIERLYLKTTDVVQAAEKLGAMGEKAAAAVPFLMGLFGDTGSLECVEESGNRFCGFGLEVDAAAAALARIGAPALQPLLAAVRSGDENAASGAIKALARMKNPRATAALFALAKDPKCKYRKQIAEQLGYIEDPRAADLLVVLAKDSDPEIRSGAMRGWAVSKDRRAADLLITGLADHDASVREAAAFGLLNLKAPKAFDALVKALGDSSNSVRNGACQALGALKDPRAIEPLVAVVIGDKENLVRFQAGRALDSITGQHFGEDGKRWQNWLETKKKQ
jgi:HEAT repeat protein